MEDSLKMNNTWHSSVFLLIFFPQKIFAEHLCVSDTVLGTGDIFIHLNKTMEANLEFHLWENVRGTILNNRQAIEKLFFILHFIPPRNLLLVGTWFFFLQLKRYILYLFKKVYFLANHPWRNPLGLAGIFV